jgi:hypothetical protein
VSKLKALFAGNLLALLVPSIAFCDKVVPIALLAQDPPSICDSIAGNLFQSCGFETGDFSGWTQSGNTASTFVVGNFDGFLPNSGTQFAAMGPSGSDGFLSQTIVTAPGDFYAIAWYLASDGGTPNDFNVSWDGNTIFSQTDITVPDFVLYSFTEVATSAATTLTFGFSSEPSYLALDDTSVTDTSVTPEPGSFALLAAGAAGLLLLASHRRVRTEA